MKADEITCELVDERDLDTRYLAGGLDPDQAEAFEVHYFGCERCWGLVAQGLEIRSALSADALPDSSSGTISSPTRTKRRWLGLAAAAGIAFAAVGVWRLAYLSEAPAPGDTLRGGELSFTVTSAASRSALTAIWPKLAEADLYQVRLYRTDGTLAAERETADTVLTLPADSLPLTRGVQLFWQVQALDRLRQPVARSELTETVLPPLTQ